MENSDAKKIKVKGFCGSAADLEKEISLFLETIPIENFVDIKMSTSNYSSSTVALVVYKT